ncbi:hypothetical protein LguiB_025012 [Lonicera macranthoides]
MVDAHHNTPNITYTFNKYQKLNRERERERVGVGVDLIGAERAKVRTRIILKGVPGHPVTSSTRSFHHLHRSTSTSTAAANSATTNENDKQQASYEKGCRELEPVIYLLPSRLRRQHLVHPPNNPIPPKFIRH